MAVMDAPTASEVRPLRRIEFDELVKAGLFEDERVELLYGSLVRMSPTKPPHDGVIQRLTELFVLALYRRAAIRIQSSFAAGDISEPQPDVAVVPPGDYLDAHPTVAWLLIEVAESSRRKDRGTKAPLYAECGVPEYWVVDLSAGLIEVYGDIVQGEYTRVVPYAKGERIALSRFPDVVIDVAEVLP
jgi:Uma2 family endonuclease